MQEDKPTARPAPTTLALGLMPHGASPTSHWAAGPWCFAGQEDLFPHWEDNFHFAAEPLRNAPALAEAAVQQAKHLYAELLPALGRELCPHSQDLPPAYWETLLAPWAIIMAQQVVERWLRVRAMCQQWGDTPLCVPLLPADCHFDFAQEQDVVLYGVQGAAFNHWLFSRLLELHWPAAWRREMLPSCQHSFCHPRPQESVLRRWLRQTQLALPCPRLKGMSSGQALRFSLALLHPSHGEDQSRSLSAYQATGMGGQANTTRTDLGWDVPTEVSLALFRAALPRSLRQLRHPASIRPTHRPRCRIASIHAYEDADYRQRLALWRGRGHRLVWVQHGGNYGQSRLACASAVVEYSQHAFITWGWDRHDASPGRFIPLPSLQLARLRDTRVAPPPGHGKLVFVGNELYAVGCRLDAHPTPLQVVASRKAKADFFAALPGTVQAASLYRPYFPLPGSLEDATWLLPRFAQVRLCTGPLLPHLLGCRLLVLDHPGTTLLEALTANIPCILFWDRQAWTQTPEADALLDGLAAAGIWQPGPQAAARTVTSIWEAPDDWWQQPARQEARRAFCRRYALTEDASPGSPQQGSPDSLWLQILQTL